MIGTQLKKLREEKEMTQEEFSNFLNINIATYKAYERNTRTPIGSSLVEISDKLDVSLDYLFGRSNIKNCYTGITKDSLIEYVSDLFKNSNYDTVYTFFIKTNDLFKDYIASMNKSS